MKKFLLSIAIIMITLLLTAFVYVDSNFPPVGEYDVKWKVDNPSVGVYTNGVVTLTIETMYSISWTSTQPVYWVFVKGGQGGNLYNYNGAYSGSGITPLNNGGQQAEISHIDFYYNILPPVEPPPVEPPPVEPPPVEPPPVEPPPVEPPPVEPPPIEPPPVEPPPVEPPFVEPPPVEPDPNPDPILDDIPVGLPEVLPQTGDATYLYYLVSMALIALGIKIKP